MSHLTLAMEAVLPLGQTFWNQGKMCPPSQKTRIHKQHQSKPNLILRALTTASLPILSSSVKNNRQRAKLPSPIPKAHNHRMRTPLTISMRSEREKL